jgi:hypothetical protein
MQSRAAKEPRRRKSAESLQSREPAVFEKEPVHSQSVSPRDDVQARIAVLAYVLYEQRGRQDGHDRDDWLTAEQRVLAGRDSQEVGEKRP